MTYHLKDFFKSKSLEEQSKTVNTSFPKQEIVPVETKTSLPEEIKLVEVVVELEAIPKPKIDKKVVNKIKRRKRKND